MGQRPAARCSERACSTTRTTVTERCVALAAFMAGLMLVPIARAQTPLPTSLPTPLPTPLPSPVASPPPKPRPSPPPAPKVRSGADRDTHAHTHTHTRLRHPDRPSAPPAVPADEPVIWWEVGYRYPGVYSTARILEVVDRLRNLGVADRVTRRVFAPFIVAGYSRFWDSWGEIRHADADSLRPHLGQDVFCNHGDPVLASERGRIQLGADSLGGLVAHLYRADGSFWYYAHLSGFPKNLASGQEVARGDVIGYCGDSGNASGSSPHVHFGLYVGGVATNPMGALIRWVQSAEAHALRILRRKTHPVRLDTRVAGTSLMWRDPSNSQLVLRCPSTPSELEPLAMLNPFD
jgi:murein DD-endopeptidase MepM/ murein hydrolase activator NlpD